MLKTKVNIKKNLYTDKDLEILDKNKVPKHVAIIMDGNRRWAKKYLLPVKAGHWQGVENLSKIVQAAAEIKVKTLTVYAFSTENWNRSKNEVLDLMLIFKKYLTSKRNELIKEGVKISVIGNIFAFDKELQALINDVTEKTKNGKRINLVLALNYGARDEITRSISKIIEDIESKKIKKEKLSEKLISKYLDSFEFDDPDLLIRTGGEKRFSNFLLWQASYSEIYFTNVYWPSFSKNDFLDAIIDYQNRKKRYGK
jgi:undecaprenyl diphosphate synthase